MSARRLAALVAVALTVAGCGSDSSTGANKPGPPTRIELVTSPSATVAAAASAGPFTVKVSDSKGAAVSGVTVSFTATGNVTVAPSSVATDANGQATTQVTSGTIAGNASVAASATGIPVTVTAAVAVIAGPATKITVTPKTLRFINVGDTARVSASALDQYGNAAASNAVTYTVVDPSLVTVDQAGLVRALRLGGTTFVVASSASKADTTVVTVLAAGASVCAGLATAPQMKVGDLQIFSGTQYACLSGSTAGAEYTFLAFNSSTDPVNPLSASILGQGLASPPSAYKAPIPGPTLMRSPLGSGSTAPMEPDERFHMQLLQRANDELGGRITRARDARRAAISRSTFGSASATQAAIGVLPATVQVGDLITMNVSAGICTNPVYHPMRVTAVGSKAIVLADTLNPTPGFSAADYLRIAANFDTLVYSMDVAAFGAPSDFDQNGHVGILFTRTVNELVNASSGYFVGGFFNPRDLFPKKGATTADDCPGSNEGEMFYMVVPAPAPGINGVTHTTGFVDSLTTGVLAHEFQHLINAGRRMYVNSAAQAFEEVWLNEGLSHIAEELLYYRQSGFTPRSNLSDSTIRLVNPSVYPYFKNDAASNFSRFLAYLRDPGSNSPFAPNDDLATRGATWSFLRYLADRLGPTDGTIWQKFDNATTTGLTNLTSVIGSDPMPFFRDWAVANYMDDDGVSVLAQYTHPSWNFRNIYTTTFLNIPTYPLKVTLMSDNTKVDVQMRGGSASYMRLAASPAKDVLLTLTSGGGAPSAPLQFIAVRTK